LFFGIGLGFLKKIKANEAKKPVEISLPVFLSKNSILGDAPRCSNLYFVLLRKINCIKNT